MTGTELEVMANQLAESGLYRILRRLQPHKPLTPPAGSEVYLALFVDVETTGLDPLEDEIIELAMVPFSYTLGGMILDVRKSFNAYSQPNKPIPPEITEMTGISDEMVEGKRIDELEVNEFVRDTRLVIAHNAAFDRRFLERRFPVFRTKNWACSMSQVDWEEEGYEGTKLAYLAMGAGFFYDSHRAELDCLAGIELLAGVLPHSGVSAMTSLLGTARLESWRFNAIGAPYEKREELKSRGYRWNGTNKTWFVDVESNAREQESKWLNENIYPVPQIFEPTRITAMDRFSDRE